MDVTRERIRLILELRETLLSIQTGFSLVNAAVVCAIRESISGLEPSSVVTEPRYLKLVTVSSFCPFTLTGFGENTELKRSPFQAWSGSVYSHTCYAYCQGFLLCLFPPFQSTHLHFFQNFSRFFPVLAAANTGSCVGPQNKIGHPVGCRFPCWVPAEYKKAKKWI